MWAQEAEVGMSCLRRWSSASVGRKCPAAPPPSNFPPCVRSHTPPCRGLRVVVRRTLHLHVPMDVGVDVPSRSGRDAPRKRCAREARSNGGRSAATPPFTHTHHPGKRRRGPHPNPSHGCRRHACNHAEAVPAARVFARPSGSKRRCTKATTSGRAAPRPRRVGPLAAALVAQG